MLSSEVRTEAFLSKTFAHQLTSTFFTPDSTSRSFWSDSVGLCSSLVHTVGGSVGLEEIREQAFLDGGVPAQGLLVQDEQEAVELHQELVQHWRHRQKGDT